MVLCPSVRRGWTANPAEKSHRRLESYQHFKQAPLAQRFRAILLHGIGRWFESNTEFYLIQFNQLE